MQVGTYVSGTIVSLTCDYNTRVHKGQLCAKIDPAPYQIIVDEDQADLATAKAQLVKDQANARLHQAGQRPRGAAVQGELRLARRRRRRARRLQPGASRWSASTRPTIAQKAAAAEGRPDQPELHQHRLAGGRHRGDAQRHRRPDRGRQPADPDPVPDRHRPDQDAGRHQRQRVRHRRRGRRAPTPASPWTPSPAQTFHGRGGPGPPGADQRAERDHL